MKGNLIMKKILSTILILSIVVSTSMLSIPVFAADGVRVHIFMTLIYKT